MKLIGKVVDGETMEPIDGATISVYTAGGAAVAIASTAQDGSFIVEDSGMGLVISAVDYLPVFAPLPHTSGITYKLTRDYESLPGIVITPTKRGALWLAALLLLFLIKK